MLCARDEDQRATRPSPALVSPEYAEISVGFVIAEMLKKAQYRCLAVFNVMLGVVGMLSRDLDHGSSHGYGCEGGERAFEKR